MNNLKITIQFEDFVIPDKEIMMPCVPAVGSWITFNKSDLKHENGTPIECNEFRVTSVEYIITGTETSHIFVSVCVNSMYEL